MASFETAFMRRYSKNEINEIRHFNSLAKVYDVNYSYNNPFTRYKIIKKTKEFIDFVNKRYGNTKLKILEVGCGTGEYTKEVATRLKGSQIIGIDISSKILGVAKIKCKNINNINFMRRSAYNAGFKKESFDIICGFYILHHLDIPKVKKELFRVLKHGGILFFYEPNVLNPLVYLIKSSKILKKMVGDSPDEWAMNPLKIEKNFKDFEVINIKMSEFIYPFKFVSFKILKFFDKLSGLLGKVPVIKYLGGSVQFSLIKK